MTKLAGCKSACGLLLFCAATAIASPAQNFTSLAAFNGDNGANPQYVSLCAGH